MSHTDDRQVSGFFAALASTAVLYGTFAATQVHAQTGESEARRAAGQVEEVVVTARKRAENIQDTPIAITSLSSAELGERGVSDLLGIINAAPSLRIQQDAGGGSLISACMRGLCRTDTIITEDQMVGFYIDGFANTKAYGALFDLLNVERIEVLRGPQGTLFGKNTLGGAISVVTARPGHEFGGDVMATVGAFDLIKLRASVNLPIGETLAANIAVVNTQRDGLIENPIGPDLHGLDNTAARLALRWNASDSLTLDYSLDWFDADQSRNASQFTYAGTGLNGLFPGISDVASPKRLDKKESPQSREVVHQVFNGLTATLDLGSRGALSDLTLKSLTGYRTTTDNTYGIPSIYWLLGSDTRADLQDFSQELQFLGSSLGGRLQFVSGLYFARGDGHFQNLFHFGSPATIRIDDLRTKGKSWAAFGEVNFDFTTNLSGSLGLRYTDEERSADLRKLNADGSLQGLVSALAPTDEVKGTNIAPRASLRYRFTEDISSYITYARGFKSGGLNGRAAKWQDFTTYDDTTLDSIEIGLKSDLWDRRARLNLAVYYQQAKDLQVAVNSVDPDTFLFLSQIKNAAKAKMQGGELEGEVNLTDSFRLQATVAYIDAEYDKFLALVPGSGVIDVADNRVFQMTPDLTWSLGARYEVPLAQMGRLIARVDYSHVAAQDFTVVHNSRIAEDDYGLVDARIEIAGLQDGAMTIALWGKNLTDEEYRIGGFDVASFAIAPPNDGLGVNIYGDRRTWGVDVGFKFGASR